MDKVIKVCHFTSAHDTEDTRIFHKECVSLAKAGYEVWLVGRGESREDKGVHVVGVGQPSGGRLSRMTGFARKVYEAALALDCDIYHFHDPELLPWGLKLKKKGKKVIYDSHEAYTLQIADKAYLGPLAKLVSKLYGGICRYIVRRLDGVVVVTPGDAEAEGYVTLPTPLVELANYPIIKDTATMGRAEEATVGAQPQVIYAGSLTEARGITVLAEAIEKCEARLVLCGSFDSEEYEQQILAMSDKIDYKGLVDLDSLYRIYDSCMAGMSTLLNVGQYALMDTLPTKVYEYMLRGLPSVMSDIPYNRAMAEQYRFGLCVDPADPEAVAGAINWLIEHPEEARQMGENGRKAALQVFNWGAEEKKLLKAYQEILSR